MSAEEVGLLDPAYRLRHLQPEVYQDHPLSDRGTVTPPEKPIRFMERYTKKEDAMLLAYVDAEKEKNRKAKRDPTYRIASVETWQRFEEMVSSVSCQPFVISKNERLMVVYSTRPENGHNGSVVGIHCKRSQSLSKRSVTRCKESRVWVTQPQTTPATQAPRNRGLRQKKPPAVWRASKASRLNSNAVLQRLPSTI